MLCACVHVCVYVSCMPAHVLDFLRCQPCGLVGPRPVGASPTCSGDKVAMCRNLGAQWVGAPLESGQGLSNPSAGRELWCRWAAQDRLRQGLLAPLSSMPLSLLECGCSPPSRTPPAHPQVVLLGQHQELRGPKDRWAAPSALTWRPVRLLFLIGKVDGGGVA